MKFVELVAKVEKLSIQDIDEMVDNGIIIENIDKFIFYDIESMKQTLFKSDKLKQLILKEINIYMTKLFSVTNKNPEKEIPENLQKIYENYFKSFYKDALELEITEDRGMFLAQTILDIRNKNDVIKKMDKDYNVWGKYRQIIKQLVTKDMTSLTEQEVIQYDKIFKINFEKVVLGGAIPEAEAMLKLYQRDDIDVSKLTSLEYLVQDYNDTVEKANGKIKRQDEIVSIILDYEILLESKGIENKNKKSQLETMKQAIRTGNFGENNVLSKEEFAFAMKMLQNQSMLDDDTNQKLFELLEKSEVNIGKRECDALLRNKELFDQISVGLPNLQNQMLKQIDANIGKILQDICDNNREITLEEMKNYKHYINEYYEMSLERNIDTEVMSKIFCLSTYLSYPKMPYNIKGEKASEETSTFFREQFESKEIFKKHDAKVCELIKKIQEEKEISKKDFTRYDRIFSEYSYITALYSEDNVQIIKTLFEKSKQLQVRSATIENQIEQYIYNNIRECVAYKDVGFHEVILDYYEEQLKGTAIEINRNPAVSHLIRAAQNGRLPQDIATRVLDKLNERKSKDEIKINDDDNLEQYMQKVAEIRLQNGRMPKECCENIIKQSILRNKDIVKFWGLIERALEDFSEYEIEDSKLEEHSVMVLDNQFLGRNTNGQYTDGKKLIKFSRTSLQVDGMIKLLETALHEITHAEQYNQIKNEDLNRDTYKMLKESILRNENPGFYSTNYQHMYNEIDARKSGYVKRLNVLKRIGLTDSQIVEAQERNLGRTIRQYRREYEEGKVKKIGKDKKNTNIMFLEQLQAKPELLEQYSALNLEFEKVGDKVQRKGLATILESYETKLSTAQSQTEIQRISSLFSEILLNGGEIPQEKMQEELKYLMNFKSENPIINAYKNKVLKTKFPQEIVIMSSMKKMYENHSQQERMEAQQVIKQAVQGKENLTYRNEAEEVR